MGNNVLIFFFTIESFRMESVELSIRGLYFNCKTMHFWVFKIIFVDSKNLSIQIQLWIHVDLLYQGLRYNIPVPKQQKQVSSVSADSVHELAARDLGKLIISYSSTGIVSPTLLDDGSKGKGLQVS